MSDSQRHQSADGPASTHFRLLVILAIVSACLYATISLVSWRFEFGSPTTERPIIAVLGLFAAAFGVYLFAIRLAVRAPQNGRLLMLIVWPAILFRVTLLSSAPIQEVDIYRYLWDGAVLTAGVSPFRYSPEQVRQANTSRQAAENIENPPELARLVQLCDEQPALAETVRRVHFGQLPTIYPPTSQIVFAAAALTTPQNASVMERVWIMKSWLLAFDCCTLFLVIGLLRLCRKPVGLCLIYAWCPLLLKEVANSGHLDAVAVFLTTLTVYLAARLLLRPSSERLSSIQTIANATLVAVCLALAVGAKLYPVVLAPLVCVALARSIGWRRVVIPTIAFIATTLLVLWPMLPREALSNSESQQRTTQAPTSISSASDPSLGVTTFLRRWEMNDFIFLVIVENLKPATDPPQQDAAWFSIAPESVRRQMVAAASRHFGIDAEEAPFLITRALTAIAFLIVAMGIAWRATRGCDVSGFCEGCFLTLAWFWLLCPTQNPWYWTWALPLLPFARSRAWLAVSGLVMLYYLRFWLSYHWPDTQVLGSGYVGYVFFDFVVTWIEYAPWFVWLAIESFYWNRAKVARVA